MPKKPSMEDIHPLHKRSIRDIPLADEIVEKPRKKKVVRKAARKIEHAADPINDHIFSDFDVAYAEASRPRWGRVSLWFFLLILLIVGGLFASSFFHSASVGVKAKEATVSVDAEIKLSRIAGSDMLPFQVVSLSKELDREVPAQGEKQVSEKASGRVILYNKNMTSQKLLSQTRLESPQGKIYRTSATVVIPGAKKSGASVIPGSVETGVIADAPGADYNSDLTDFTIPGFKGTLKYQNVYGRSKTPLQGGVLGTVKVANPDEIADAKALLRDDLKKQLLDSVSEQKPETFALLADMYSIHYATTSQESKENSVVVRQKADFVGVLVNSQTFANFLASKTIRGYSGEDVSLANTDDLSFVPSIASSTLTTDTAQFSVNVKGNAHFIYLYDVAKLKGDLAGMSQESFPTILATYPGIEKGDVKIEPFWRTVFPKETAKITISQE